MSSPRKPASGKNFQQRSQKAKKRQAKRAMRVEQLEDRRLMAIVPIDGKYYPPIGKSTADFSLSVPRALYTQRSEQQYGRSGSSGGIVGSGESNNTSVTLNEVEPNNFTRQAQLLPLGTSAGKSMVVTVNGQLPLVNGIRDVDYYAFDAKAGDLLTVKLTHPVSQIPFDVSVVTFNENEYIGSKTNQLGGVVPATSPLNDTTSNIAFAEFIPADGRYYVRVGDGTSNYSLRLEARRPSIESEPIGTKQIVFVDFDGAFLPSGLFGLPITSRVSPMMQALAPFGFTAAQESELIDKIMANLRRFYTGDLPTDGGNGYFAADSRPGAFDIEFRNSRDHADPWGLPNVSRLVVGGNFPIPTRGIAESIDHGNFDREETAVVSPEILAGEILTVPRSPDRSLLDAVAAGIATTGAHEIGHYLGLRHQENFNNLLRIMDAGGLPYGPSRLGTGVDGIWGTADDVRVRFGGIDDYLFGEGLTGRIDHAINVSFALSTGKRGNTISGVVYNDRNRNGNRDASDEGLAGWEVFVDLNGNGLRELGETRALSAADGSYSMVVAPGTYNVRVVRPAGWIASTNAEIVKTVVATSGSAVANFGNTRTTDQVTGFKWLDINGDGIRDDNEPGLAGVYIYLDLDGDKRPDLGEPAAISGADGSYTLTPPRAGTYSIREVVESGFRQTFPADNEGHTVVYDGSTPLRGFNFGNAESADWGDAPPAYPTTRLQGGASHGQAAGLRLGTLWDSEPDGKPSTGADGDDLAGIDDEDGVQLLNALIRGDSSNLIEIRVTNTTGTLAYVNGWMDFNGDGDWNDVGEQIISGLEFASGAALTTKNVMFSAPANTVDRVNARFRLSGQRNLGPAGRATSGEVEDYVFTTFDPPRRNLQPDRFTVSRNSRDNVFDVLANDFTPAGTTWTIEGVSSTLRGGRVVIDTANNRILYSPALSFIGVDEFEYTARSSTGIVERAKVTVTVLARFIDPVAIDDSFDIPTNSIGFPLNVLANDIEGQNGALVITSVTNPSRGGTVTIGTGGQSLRYTPVRNFGGTETFEYTATDGAGRSSTARITVHTLAGDRLDDNVEFSFDFFDLQGNPITRIQQGQQFRVSVYVDDLRPERLAALVPPQIVVEPGVYSAYLDILYNAGLISPVAPNGQTGLDFNVTFANLYPAGRTGSAQIPGIINELGAFAGSIVTMDNPGREKLADLLFTANSPGLAEFVGDPADVRPQSDVTLFNVPRTPVPTEEIRYRRATIEIVPSGTDFPFAKDDSPALIPGARIPLIPGGQPSTIDVLANDIVGSNGPIRVTSIRSTSSNGQVVIVNNGTAVQYIPNTNFVGTDQFQYTITDQRGFTSTATVTVNVGTVAQVTADDLVELRLAVTDINGVEINEVEVGRPFQLRGFVKDLRDSQNPRPTRPGVFAAYQDILFNSNLAIVNADLLPFFGNNFAGEYRQGKSGDSRIPGLLNEIGSFQTSGSPLGFGEILQFVINFTAGATTGTVNFVGDPADVKPFHDTLLFDRSIPPLEPFQIRYTRDSVRIVPVGGLGLGGTSGEGFTNLLDSSDVNGDGFVSAIDALIVINALNSGGSGPVGSLSDGASGENGEKYYLDTNADGFVDPLDVLQVITRVNEDNQRLLGVGLSGGEGELVVNSGELPLVEIPLSNDPLNIDSWQYGPAQLSEEEEEAMTLAEYLATVSADDDYLDDLSKGLLR